jgi:hypothetical protein
MPSAHYHAPFATRTAVPLQVPSGITPHASDVYARSARRRRLALRSSSAASATTAGDRRIDEGFLRCHVPRNTNDQKLQRRTSGLGERMGLAEIDRNRVAHIDAGGLAVHRHRLPEMRGVR